MKKTFIIVLFILTSFASLAESAMTLYFIPSPYGIDWTTPSSLAWTALKNKVSLQSRFMGHVFIELDCQGQKELTGMRGRNFDYLHQLLVNSRGLGILYHSFDGMLEDKTESEAEIKELSETGERLNFIRFKINAGQCSRAMTYLKEYREKNVGRYYGLANRPLYGEGSGCSAFGASFVEVTGLMTQDFKDGWSQTVNIPLEFAGPPLKDEGVNLLKLMMNASKWAADNEPHQKLMFWSPDLMFNWVQKQITLADKNKQFSLMEIGKAKGIVFDKSQIPTPLEPIWQQRLESKVKTFKSKN